MSYVHVCVSFSLCHGVVTVISSCSLSSPGWTKATWRSGGIQALMPSSTLLIMALIGQEMPGLWGYQAQHGGTEMSICYNPPPWINIQQGLSHFARLFVATQWRLHWYTWMKMSSYLQGERHLIGDQIMSRLLHSSVICTGSVYFIIHFPSYSFNAYCQTSICFNTRASRHQHRLAQSHSHTPRRPSKLT